MRAAFYTAAACLLVVQAKTTSSVDSSKWEYEGPAFNDEQLPPSQTGQIPAHHEPTEKSKADSSPFPSRRIGPGTWHDATGNWWLFGGQGPVARSASEDGSKPTNFLSDLWVYSRDEISSSSSSQSSSPSFEKYQWKLEFRPETNSESPYSSYPENLDFPLLCGSTSSMHLALFRGHKSNPRASAESHNSPFSEDNVVWLYDIPRASFQQKVLQGAPALPSSSSSSQTGPVSDRRAACNWSSSPESCNGTGETEEKQGLWTSYVCCDACLPDGNTTFEFCPQFSRDPISWCSQDSLMMLQLVSPPPPSSSETTAAASTTTTTATPAGRGAQGSKGKVGMGSSRSAYSTSTTTFTSGAFDKGSKAGPSDGSAERYNFNEDTTAKTTEKVDPSKHEIIRKNGSIQQSKMNPWSGETGRSGGSNSESQGAPAGSENSNVDSLIAFPEQKAVGQREKRAGVTVVVVDDDEPDRKSEKMKRNGSNAIKNGKSIISQQSDSTTTPTASSTPTRGRSWLNWWKFDLASQQWIKKPEVNIEGELTEEIQSGSCRAVSTAEMVYVLCPTKGNLLDRTVLLFDPQKASIRLLGTIHLNNAFTDKKVWQLGRSVLEAVPCDNQTVIFLAYHKLLDLWIHDHSSNRLYPVENVWKGSSLHTFQRVNSFYKLSISLPIPSENEVRSENLREQNKQEEDDDLGNGGNMEKRSGAGGGGGGAGGGSHTTYSFFMVNPRSKLANFDDPFPTAHFHITIVPDREVFLPPRDATYLISSTEFQSDKAAPLQNTSDQRKVTTTPTVKLARTEKLSGKNGNMGVSGANSSEGENELGLSQTQKVKSNQNEKESGSEGKVAIPRNMSSVGTSLQTNNSARTPPSKLNKDGNPLPTSTTATTTTAENAFLLAKSRMEEHRKNKYRTDIRSPKRVLTKQELLGASGRGGSASGIEGLSKKRIIGIKRTISSTGNSTASSSSQQLGEIRVKGGEPREMQQQKVAISTSRNAAVEVEPQVTVIMTNNTSVGSLTTDQVEKTTGFMSTPSPTTNNHSKGREAGGGDAHHGTTGSNHRSNGSVAHDDARNNIQFNGETAAKSHQGSPATPTTTSANASSISMNTRESNNEKDTSTTTSISAPRSVSGDPKGQPNLRESGVERERQAISPRVKAPPMALASKMVMTGKEQTLMNADRRNSGKRIMIKEQNNTRVSNSFPTSNGKTQTNSTSSSSRDSVRPRPTLNLATRVGLEEGVVAGPPTSLLPSAPPLATFNSSSIPQSAGEARDHEDGGVAGDGNINQPQELHQHSKVSLESRGAVQGKKEIDQVDHPPGGGGDGSSSSGGGGGGAEAAKLVAKLSFKSSWNQPSNLSVVVPAPPAAKPTFIDSPDKRAEENIQVSVAALKTVSAASNNARGSGGGGGNAIQNVTNRTPNPSTEASSSDTNKKTHQDQSNPAGLATANMIPSSSPDKNPSNSDRFISPSTKTSQSSEGLTLVTPSVTRSNGNNNHHDGGGGGGADAEEDVNSLLSPMTYGSSEIGVEPRDDIMPYGQEGSLNGEVGYGPTLFFAISLSFFASIGVVLFVRRCVKCPPRRESVLIKEPPPIRYSVIPDDLSFHTPIV